MPNLLFSFSGRVGRRPFWALMAVMFFGQILAMAADFAISGYEYGVVTFIFFVSIVWPALAIQAKRWHDRNKSAWWILLNAVPVVGPLWTIVECGFVPGTAAPNRFGPPIVEHPIRPLGGWWRLWVVAAAVYGALVAAHTVFIWPSTESIAHRAAFEDRFSSDVKRILTRRSGPWNDYAVGERYKGVALEMPNGHTFEVADGLPQKQYNLLAREYIAMLKEEESARRWLQIRNSFLIWLVPSAAALFLGHAVGWVFRGFRGSNPDLA